MKKSSFQRLAEEASLEMRCERTDDRGSTTSLEQRTLMLLRALHGREDYSDEEFQDARHAILEEMATDVLRGSTSRPTVLGPSTAPSPRPGTMQYSERLHRLPSISASRSPKASRFPEPHPSRRPPEGSLNSDDITNAALAALEDALNLPDDRVMARTSHLAEPRAYASVSKLSVGDAPGDLEIDPTERRPGRKETRSRDSIAGRAARIFNLQRPKLTGWQWSGLGTAMAATAVIAVFGFQVWQTHLQSEKSFQIAMVTIEDRSVFSERQAAHRTRGDKPQVPTAVPSSSDATGGARFQDFEVPTALLRGAIASTSTGKMSTEYSELMNYLRARNSAIDGRSQILIDADLAARVSESAPDVTNTQIRVYDLTDPRSAPVRSEIKTLGTDAHAVLLTLGR